MPGKRLLRAALVNTVASVTSRLLPSFENLQLRDEIMGLEARKTLAPLAGLEALQAGTGVWPSAWRELGPIGYQIVRHYSPSVIVELGSFGGYSTGALALAARENGVGHVYAVDTWEGDPHVGFTDESIYLQFERMRTSLDLAAWITPLRMTFAEAASKIHSPVNLLHIDGWHTFRAVRRDLATYRHLLAPGAIVLFHDVNTVFPGMRIFWLLMTLRFPAVLLPYSHGLGVLRIPQ